MEPALEQVDTDDPLPKPTRKRQRPERQRPDVTYPRKRAIAACRLCRSRKVKCNNARPICGACSSSNAQCIYEDSDDCSPFDSASIAILDRLNQVLYRLDQLPMQGVVGQTYVPNPLPMQTSVSGVTELNLPDIQARMGQEHETPESLWIPSAKTAPESILAWPVLANIEPSKVPTVDALIDSCGQIQDNFNDLPTEHSDRSLSSETPSINEDDIPKLVQGFVDHVHIKNPVVDIDVLELYTQRVMEHGIRWDAASCLVLLTCALGSIAQGYKQSLAPDGSTSQNVQRHELNVGNAYYNAACRRLGLLGSGLLTPQCYFFAGVYLMYNLRPLQAWSQFRRASQAYHIYWEIRKFEKPKSAECTAKSQASRLGQRLYWSCYKTECEFRVELDLPNSTLADFCHADMHPSPPGLLNPQSDMMDNNDSPIENASSSAITSCRIRESRSNIELSWYYYLTEITLRRIANKVLNTFYDSSLSTWTAETMASRVIAAEEFESQLDKCMEQLPASLQFDAGQEPTEELPVMIWGRIYEIKCWLCRPFLYHAIHCPMDVRTWDLIQPFVDKAVKLCFQGIKRGVSRHRHHGTWFGVRMTTASALCILAARKSGQVEVPARWREDLQSLIETMRYWEDEAPYVSQVIQTLEILTHNVDGEEDGDFASV